MITDQHVLDGIIESFKKIDGCLPTNIMGIKDLNSKHLFCSKYYLNLLKLEESDIKDKVVINNYVEKISNQLIIEEDQYVISKKKHRSYILITNFNNQHIPRLVIKNPLINPDSNNVIGIFYQIFEMDSLNFQNYLLESYNLIDDKKNINKYVNLSKREKQVIFFFLAHLSSQSIANTLSKIESKKISKSTIDSIFINQLYIKFEVYNRNDLFKRLIEGGYDNFIPENILANVKNIFTPMIQKEIY